MYDPGSGVGGRITQEDAKKAQKTLIPPTHRPVDLSINSIYRPCIIRAKDDTRYLNGLVKPFTTMTELHLI